MPAYCFYICMGIWMSKMFLRHNVYFKNIVTLFIKKRKKEKRGKGQEVKTKCFGLSLSVNL